MRTLKLFKQLSVWLLGACLCMGVIPAAYAVDELGLFQLDGNPSHDAGVGGDDWETLYNNGNNDGGNADRFTGIQADLPNATIFAGGGSKDINDISSWLHKNGSVSQKSDITNAYAAAYIYPGPDTAEHKTGDLIIYMGADRLDNEGDTFMGFWFFQNSISRNAVPPTGPGGTFNGLHMNEDVLVLMNFPQANNAVPDIKVIVWDSTCSKAANNNPQPGQCAAKNLRLIESQSAENAVCTDSFGANDQVACAITNLEGTVNDGVASPWPYVSAEGDVNNFPFETFYEGGINISNLLPDSSGCFSSFMAETRSSKEYTASLEDFKLADFQLCGADGVTTIHDGSNDDAEPHDIIQLNSSTAVVGDTIHDSVLITGSSLAGGVVPFPSSSDGAFNGADVVFTLYHNGTCDKTVPAEVLHSSTGLLSPTASSGVSSAESGDYTLEFTGAHSWKAEWDGDDNYPAGAGVSGGGVIACEPFNVIQPKLTICKEILSCANDSGTFAVSVDGTNDFNANLGDPTVTSFTDGDTKGPNGLAPASYTVRETAQDAYVAVYDGTLTQCGSTASGSVQSITLEGNDDKTCVFLNVRKPRVTVTKVIDGTGAFDLLVDNAKVNTSVALSGTTLISTYDATGMDFGEPIVAEQSTSLTLDQYSTNITCDDGTVANFLPTEVSSGNADDLTGVRQVAIKTLDPGVHVSCKITNVQLPSAPACLSTP